MQVMGRFWTLSALVVAAFGLGPAALAQQPCPPYDGITCDGYVTDAVGVVTEDDRLEEAVALLIQRHGHETAVVVVGGTGGRSAEEFASGLGDTWGVGDPAANDGVVVLIDTGGRVTWIQHGPGLNDVSVDWGTLAEVGNPSFRDGDFDGGILAILSALDGAFTASNGDSGGDPGGSSSIVGIELLVVVAGTAILAYFVVGRARSERKSQRRKKRRERQERVDAQLARLRPAGHELPLLQEFHVEPPTSIEDGLLTSVAAATLQRLIADEPVADKTALESLWHHDLVDVVDRARLMSETEVPLELRASSERDLLDDAVQAAARDALAVPIGDDDRFEVALVELTRLVESLRPHRVAEARRSVAEALDDRLQDTAIGPTVLTDKAERFVKVSPVLEADRPITASLDMLEANYRDAAVKTRRLEDLYGKLPSSVARPAVAAALADVDENLDRAVERYESVRRTLEESASVFERDGLDIPALAALLLLNHDELAVDEFLRAYRRNRSDGLDPSESVEYALAGLSTPREIHAVRRRAESSGLPVSITAALMNREGGFEIFEQVSEELTTHGITGDSRRTIAGILAVSLEPSQAVRRWLDCREALTALGLEGSYADVAAAFGASDPRGPREFALAYAAQRQALARSDVEDADRFAPQLAHAGTSRQEDTWTGRPLPPGIGYFDPFTFFYFHWVITRGHGGSFGWEPVYRDRSWSGDTPSWFGGFGGGMFGGGRGGGSSWGGGGWSPGSFGGFGGGGFGGGGGGGGSGW